MKSVGTMLADLEDCDERLTNWERSFLADVAARYSAAGLRSSVLTGPQVEKIEQIYRLRWQGMVE